MGYWLVDSLKANHGYYLFGEFYVDADKMVNVIQIEAYYPALWGGDKVRLHYAKAEDFTRVPEFDGDPWRGGGAVLAEAGDAPVELAFDAAPPAEGVPRPVEGVF